MILYYTYFNVTIELTIKIFNKTFLDYNFINTCSSRFEIKKGLFLKCLITDKKYTDENSFDKIFFCIDSPSIEQCGASPEEYYSYYDNILKNVPYSQSILEGNECINFYNLIPEIFHHNKIPFIVCNANFKNENIIMREYSSNDYNNVYNFFHPLCKSNPDSIQFMHDEYIEEYNNLNNLCQSYSFDNTGYYGLFINNNLIGQIAIIHHSYNNQLQFELSYYIDSKFRGANIASFFSKELLKYFYIFHDKSEIIYTKIMLSNIISASFIEKIGFKLYENNENHLIYTNKGKKTTG